MVKSHERCHLVVNCSFSNNIYCTAADLTCKLANVYTYKLCHMPQYDE